MGGLPEIQDSGVLRVVVAPGWPGPAQSAESSAPSEPELLERLADRLSAQLEVIESPRHDLVLPWLLQGRADLAVSRYSPAALLGSDLSATEAVSWVDDLLVGGPSSSLGSFDEAEGQRVHIHRSRLRGRVGAALSARHLIPVAVPEEVPIAEVVERVRRGRYQLTVVDSELFARIRPRGGLRQLGPLVRRRPLVWACRERSPKLRAAVNGFLFAEQLLGRSTRVTECRDLRQVRRAGVLRLVTRNSPTTCAVERGGLDGFEYALASEFARRLGVRLELAIPPVERDPADWLELGFGDLLALHEPASPGDERRFLVSPPYLQVDALAVGFEGREPPGQVEGLAGRRLAASRALGEIVNLLPLEPPPVLVPLGPGGDALTALREMARGTVDFAIVDRHTVTLDVQDRPGMVIGPVVLRDLPLVWLFNGSSPELHREASRFLSAARLSGLVRQLVLSDLGSWQPYVPKRLEPVPEGALSPFDELLQWAGRTWSIDWRLLAALMYEESRFDPDAIGPGGSAGLFQLMPSTWRELGVEDPHHPAESADAAGRYLSQLMKHFGELPLQDRAAMAIASYNVGPGHVFDARRLAAQMQLDPDRWAGNVETALLLLDDPEVSRQFSGGICRCRRAVGYTRRILRRYQAYVEQFPPS